MNGNIWNRRNVLLIVLLLSFWGATLGGWQEPVEASAPIHKSLQEAPVDPSSWKYYIINWSTVSPMPTPRFDFGVALAKNGKIYVIGGANGSPNNTSLSTVEEYDIEKDQWTSKANMPMALQGIAAVAAENGKVYVMGGRQLFCFMPDLCEWVYSGSLYEYDPELNSWTSKANMPYPRSHLAAVYASNAKIYTFGGLSDINYFCPGPYCMAIVGEYDLATDTWQSKTNLPTPRYAAAAVEAKNGRIYVIGGTTQYPVYDVKGTVEEYDPTTDTWQSRAGLPPFGRFSLTAVAASNGRIYASGGAGFNQYYVTNAVSEYNPVTDTWVYSSTGFIARAGLGAVITAEDKIFAIGGSGSSGVIGLNQMGTISALDHSVFLPIVER